MLSGAQETWGVKSPAQEQRHSCQPLPPQLTAPGVGFGPQSEERKNPFPSLSINYWLGLE